MISNHAVSRYLERVCGWRQTEAEAGVSHMREAVETDLLSYRAVAAALALSHHGQCKVVVGRYRIVCNGGVVVTVEPASRNGSHDGRICRTGAGIRGRSAERRENWRREVEA